MTRVARERNRIDVDLGEPGVAVVALHGEHETHGALELERRLLDLARGGRALVIDLTAATFVDSAVLGALLRARARADQAGTRLVLVLGEDLEQAIPRILRITGLLRKFETAQTRAEAVRVARRTTVAA
jgi:anti-sigma B factor antagonist